MARPKFPAPVFPSQSSPSKSGSGKCGSSYHTTYEVRAPYKSTDKYSVILPVAYGKSEIGESKIESSIKAVLKDSFHSALKDAISGASEILTEYDAGGYIDDSNRDIIMKMISRAETYRDQAAKIRKWWEESYRPDPDKQIYGWPLGEDNVRGCEGFAPSKGSVYVGSQGQGASVVEFTCPSNEDKDFHDADRVSYQQLLYASMLNARCAQEAAATVGVFNKNKDFLESGSGGMGISSSAPDRSPSGRITTGPTSGSDPESAPEAESESEPKGKKRKGGGLMLAGAAGLGLLLLRGRK